MVTRAENELLTRVGRGTPMGELLCRYWWPVGVAADLREKPTFVRILGEDLVLFRDGQGRVGAIGALCSHRRANLCLGSTEERGLRCRYHGWLYDTEGTVLQTPGEPADSTLKDRINHLGYPAEELGGLVFVYMGPRPAPLLPRFDFLAGEGEHYVRITGFANCNWLQCVENGIDPLHVSFTHSPSWHDLQVEPDMGFEETPWGLVHKALRPAEREGTFNYREHHLLMPCISIGGSGQRNLVGAAGTPPTSGRWSVPIDDTHTMMGRSAFKPADNPGQFKEGHLPAGWTPIAIEPFREYKESDTPTLGYTIARIIASEDAAIMDSLGAIVDRENENLLTDGDYGIQRLRELYLRETARVEAGADPLGTIRDPAQNAVITIPAYELLVDDAARKTLMPVS